MTDGIANAHLQRFAIFFFLAFLDERLAAEISDRAAANYKTKNLKNLDGDSPEMRLLTINLCRSYWEANKKRMSRKELNPRVESFGKLPADVSLQPWIKFHKQTSDDEIIVFILSQVLKFSEQEVSEALKISIGTLRHRVSRSIRTLGAFANG
nr:Sigma-70, region 4 [uncultured bacterium]